MPKNHGKQPHPDRLATLSHITARPSVRALGNFKPHQFLENIQKRKRDAKTCHALTVK